MIRQLAAASLLALSASAALAADPVIEEPVPVAVDVFSWSGAYAGAHIGYGWGDTDTTGFDDGFADPTAGLDSSYDIDGVFGGVQAGYNWQVNQFVFGVETDFSFAGIDGDVELGGGDVALGTEIDWFGTVRGRVGFAVDRTLIYATGGFAYGQVENTADFGGGDVFSDDDTSTGWTAGGGVEHAFTDHLTVKAEYLFVDLNDQTLVGVAPETDVSFDNAFHTVRLGFNYKF